MAKPIRRFTKQISLNLSDAQYAALLPYGHLADVIREAIDEFLERRFIPPAKDQPNER